MEMQDGGASLDIYCHLKAEAAIFSGRDQQSARAGCDVRCTFAQFESIADDGVLSHS